MDDSTASFVLRERPEEKTTLVRVVVSSSFCVCAAANVGVDSGTRGRRMPQEEDG